MVKSQLKSPPSMAELRSKLSRIVSRHQQTKVAFHNLKSQIQIGLLQADDVFASLAIPLMRLVGLKDGEMAEEGRFSTIIINTNMLSQWRSRRSENESETLYATEGKEEEDSYAYKASRAGKELIQKQKLQLTQLVQLLKQIETQVNSSHDDILQTLADHRASIQKFFQRALAYVAAVKEGENNGTFLITLKLLRATFERLDVALGSVEEGVENMMHELAEQMCTPMVEYVKSLKAEMTTGTFLHLLTIVEEMRGALRDGRLELEQARKKVRAAEERNIETLSRLKKSEERIRGMKEYLGSLIEAREEFKKYFVPHKLLGMEDQAKDESFLWELLKKKRKYQKPESPLGPPQVLPCIGTNTNNNYLNPTGKRPLIRDRPITRNFSRGQTPQTPCLESCLLVGSSPSVATRRVFSRNRVTP